MSPSRISLFLITILGLILRLGAMNAPVTYDEAYTYVAFASRSAWAAISDYSLPNNHIFHTLLVQLSVLIFGNHPWSIRAPALLAGLGSIVMVYFLGKKLYSIETGLAASALVAYFPAMIHFSTDARGYSLVALFTLITFYFGVRATKDADRLINWFLLIICTALGFFTIPIMLFPAGALFLWLFLEGIFNKSIERKTYFIRFFVSGFVTGILVIFLYLPVLIVSGWRRLLTNGFVQPVDAKEYFGWILAQHLSDTWTNWIQGVPAILVIVLVIGFALSSLLHWRIAFTRIPLQFVVFVWLSIIIVLRRPDAYDRFWSFLLAPCLLWSISGIIEAARKFIPMVRWLPATLTGITICVVLLQTVIILPSIPYQWNKVSNAELTAIYLKEGLVPGDLILVGYPNNAPIWYYLELHDVPDSYWNTEGKFSRALILLAANQKDQTLEGIVKSYQLDPALFALDQAQNIGHIGQIYVYESEIR